MYFKKIDFNSIENDEFIDKHLGDVKITWQDGEDADNRDIEFFPQNHMYEIAKDPKKTDKLIEKIIKEKDHDKTLLSYERFIENNRTDIINKINTLFKLQTEIDNPGSQTYRNKLIKLDLLYGEKKVHTFNTPGTCQN
ncbi:MAG: hypothetical protein GXO89_11595 [Chlorobi bacterium]|nr:hypothetical protein [Chlorobiota bacterium]